MPAARREESDLHESGDHARAGPAETRCDAGVSHVVHAPVSGESHDAQAADWG